MTPGQLNRHLTAYNERSRQRFVEVLTGGWWSAAFARPKKLPALDKIIARVMGRQDDKPRQSWQDMKAVAMQWVAHMRKANRRGKKP